MKYIELKNKADYDLWLDKCKELVLKDIETSGLCEQWDGKPTNITPEKHFDDIVMWCDNIKSTVWSIHDSSKLTFYTSYGAKHRCESYLKCYVANNWMKLAMIFAGLEVVNAKDVDKETGYVNKSVVRWQDILTNSENFICRRTRDKDNYDTIKYDYLCPYVTEDIKYIG